MAGDTPSSIPQEIRAGDTVRWRRELTDFPPGEDWQLSYTAVSTTEVHTVAAAADGSGHLVSIPAATTKSWTPGTYRVQEYVTKGDERFSLSAVNLRVLPDLAAMEAGADLRSHARKVLDAIEAWLESKAPVAGSLEVAGRKISHYPIADLLALRDRYRSEVRSEEAGNGTSGRGSKLLVRI